ncbi:MAG TPA: ABC transporter substrate-binding protein [Stellaceae bacterium]|nr:ABC transporter substrate-binding protein [Stellaceae bacterium]
MKDALFAAAVTLASVTLATTAFAGGKYDPGASDTTIKIGNTFPYSGPVSVTAPQVRQMKAYFDYLNAEKGGINGRKIDFDSLDDGYQPPKTVELTRRLVEQDQVLLMFGSEGTPTQVAVEPYLNSHKIPQLFVLTGSNSLINPAKYPYTVATGSSYGFEGYVWAKYILANRPNAKIGIFYQDDDFGSDHIDGFMKALGDKAKTMIVGKQSYAVTDPTVTSQIISLKSAGADTFVLFAQSRAAAQAISVARDQAGPNAMIFVPYVASAMSVLGAVGNDKLTGVLSDDTVKDTTDPQWANDPGAQAYIDLINKYVPEADRASDRSSAGGYTAAQAMARVLQEAGDDLTRANIMKIVTHMDHWTFPIYLPGISLNTTPDNLFPMSVMQMKAFNGTRWVLIGKPISDQ